MSTDYWVRTTDRGYLLGAVGMLLLLVGCRSATPEEQRRLPDVPVWYVLDLMSEGHALLEPLSQMSLTHPRTPEDRLGHAGLLVTHLSGARGAFCAYEAACPYEWPTLVPVLPVPESQLPSGLLLGAECPKCHSLYDLTMGVANPVWGPAKSPLTRYRCRRVDDLLLISN